MRIYIATVSRDAVIIEIPDTAKVSDLKKEISVKIPDIKLADQILKFESKVLLDPHTIKQSGITENSIIELLTLRKNLIYIKMAADTKTHELEVDFTKNVDALKKQISQLFNVPTESQRLFMTELKNKDVLKAIEPGTTLHLCVIELNLKLNLVHTKSTFPIEPIEIPKGNKISQLKDLIAIKWKIPSGHQSITYNGQVLDNKKTLADYNIQNLSNILVKPINIEIFIDVTSLGRNRLTVHTLQNETIDVVKKKIKNSLKIGTEFQKLIWNGTVLNDRDILADKGIVTGSTLSLIPVVQNFKVNISFGVLENVAIDTHLNEMIIELKQKIELATNISAVQQILSLGGTELQNDKKIFDYGIIGGSNIVMCRRDTFELSVETATGINVMKTLYIQNPYEAEIEIEIGNSATVLDLKKMIAAKMHENIMVTDQILKYRSTILIDLDTINTSGIQDNSVVELTLQNCFAIFVKTDTSRLHPIHVHFTNTIELVKKMLYRLLAIDVNKQRLFFNGTELNNGVILRETMIKPGNTIDLMGPNLNLSIVERSGNVEPIDMPSNTTIAQLRQVISIKYKVPAGYQILTYNDQVLDKTDKTLADYNIKDLSKIHFRPNDIEIFIQSTTGGRNRMTLRVLPIDTISQVKDKIETESHINKNAQQLIWSGRVLADDAILSSENIRTGSTLSLVATVQKCLKLKVLLEPEEIILIDVHPSDTIAQIKTKILNVCNIPIDQQVLYLKKQELQDSKILSDYDLIYDINGDNVVMERKDAFNITVFSISNRKIRESNIPVHKTDSVINVKAQIERRLGILKQNQELTYGGIELLYGPLENYGIDKSCDVSLNIIKR